MYINDSKRIIAQLFTSIDMFIAACDSGLLTGPKLAKKQEATYWELHRWVEENVSPRLQAPALNLMLNVITSYKRCPAIKRQLLINKEYVLLTADSRFAGL